MLRPSGLIATEFGSSSPIARAQPPAPLAATQPVLPAAWVSLPVRGSRAKIAIASLPEEAT